MTDTTMIRRTTAPKIRALAAVTIAGAVMLTACSGSSATSTASSAVGSGAPAANTTPVHIGFFPNLTHAPALVAVAEGFFDARLGKDNVKTQVFNAGPDVVQALFSGGLDIAYVGPNPTINAYAQSDGSAIKVISGTASGGASLVVKKGVTNAAGLKGLKIASPQLGNTQDVALRYWLKQAGLATTVTGGGDVKILPQKNAQGLTAFVSGQIDGAWVPEPYATQYVEKGATVLVDEKSLWPDGKFVTTDVVVRTQFLTDHPDAVKAFLEAQLDALDLIKKDPAKAQADVIAQLKVITNVDVSAATVATAWKNVDFTADPLSATLKESAKHAVDVGVLDAAKLPKDNFAGLYSLDLLNAALTARSEAAVTS